jgi:hypothetical protein
MEVEKLSYFCNGLLADAQPKCARLVTWLSAYKIKGQ